MVNDEYITQRYWKAEFLMPLFVIFIIIPLAEIIIFMSVSDIIGLGSALIMALLTAILGGAIVRHQGIQAIISAQNNLERGAVPSREIFDGICLVAAGATLITPGFITDAIGFLLLIPGLRGMIFEKLINGRHFRFSGFGASNNTTDDKYSNTNSSSSGVIDVEYETIDEDTI